MRSVSLTTMIEQLDGLRETSDLTDWENSFVASIVERQKAIKQDTRSLSAKQAETVQSIWQKHFS